MAGCDHGDQVLKLQVLGYRDDVRAGYHDLPRRRVFEVEDASEPALLVPLEDAAICALGDELPDLLFGVGVVAFGGRCHAQSARDGVGRAVEDSGEGVEQDVEEPHERRHEEGGPLGLLDGERLGRQLPEDHVQKGGDKQGYGYGYGVQQRGRKAQGPQQRLDEVGDSRLGQGADAKRADRDAELADGQVPVELLLGDLDQAGRGLALLHETVHLRRPYSHEGELRRHEQAVQGDEQECGQDSKDRQAGGCYYVQDDSSEDRGRLQGGDARVLDMSLGSIRCVAEYTTRRPRPNPLLNTATACRAR